MNNLLPIYQLPTPLPVGEVIFLKITYTKKEKFKHLFNTFKHLKPQEILKQFGPSTSVARVINTGEYFYIDPNVMGYVMSERRNNIFAESDSVAQTMFGYDIKWEALNREQDGAFSQGFMYENSLLPISDIVILGAQQLYEEIMGEQRQ